MRDIRHVHRAHAGPLWKAGVPIFQQDGVRSTSSTSANGSRPASSHSAGRSSMPRPAG